MQQCLTIKTKTKNDMNTKANNIFQRIALTAFLILHVCHGLSSISSSSSSSAASIIQEVRAVYDRLESRPAARLKYSDTIKFSFEPGNTFHDDGFDTYDDEDDDDDVAWRKQVFERVRNSHSGTKPIAIYFPGLDCTGISAEGQFHDLANTYELWRMTVDNCDTSTSFTDLVGTAVQFINDLVEGDDRKVTIIGESFGGLVAPAVTLRSQAMVSGLVMVNPATSFDDTMWSTVGPFLTSLQYLSNSDDERNFPTPYSVLGGIALSLTVPDFKQLQQIIELITSISVSNFDDASNILRSLSDGFGILEERLPAETLKFRLSQWLPTGSQFVNQRLDQIRVPTLVVAGSDDNMLPSKSEGARLSKNIKNCTVKDVRGSGHFVLDSRVNLTQVILDSPLRPIPKEKYDPIVDWKEPTEEQIQETIENQIQIQRDLTSPIFFSTSENDKIAKGLAYVPGREDRPLLFVANHQFGGQDLGLIISQLLEDRKLPVRGLAHPIIFGAATTQPQDDSNNLAAQGGMGGSGTRSTFEKFGAVMVTPKNYYRLMETRQAALLFPGGVREVFHGKDEAYKLLWPEKTDFVRTAAKFNATIVPLCAIGSADSVNIYVDAPDMLKLPFGLGERIANSSSAVGAARFDQGNEEELFAVPFALPKPLPARHYFLFCKPFSTSDIDYRDKQSCDQLYVDIQKRMETGFDNLLHARESDPFADSLKRLTYEKISGKKAASFGIDSLQNIRK